MKKPKNYKGCLRVSAFIILAVISLSCGRLSQSTANETFLKEHPSYTIIFSETGEGWDGVGYHHFAFKKPNDENIYKEVWTFVQQDDGTWKVTGRWTPQE